MDGLWNANIHYDRRLAACVPAAAGAVLDVGCGDGFLAARLDAQTALAGVSPSDVLIDEFGWLACRSNPARLSDQLRHDR